MKTAIIAALTLLALTASVCTAQDSPSANAPETTFQAGPGLLISDNPYKGTDTRFLPVPMVFYQQGRFLFAATRASWVFHYEDGLMVSGLAKIRFEGYKSGDSRYLHGMSDRRPTLEAGLSATQEFDWATLSAEWTSDVLNEHRGHEFRVTAWRRFPDVFGVEKLTLTPSVGGNWRSKQLNSHYYGVRPGEAAAGRPEYDVDDTLNLLTAARLNYPLNDRWSLFTNIAFEWLASDITDSPIVGRHYRLTLLLGTLYAF